LVFLKWPTPTHPFASTSAAMDPYYSNQLWASSLLTSYDPFEPFPDTDEGFCGFRYGQRELFVGRGFSWATRRASGTPGSSLLIMRIPYWSIVIPLTPALRIPAARKAASCEIEDRTYTKLGQYRLRHYAQLYNASHRYCSCNHLRSYCGHLDAELLKRLALTAIHDKDAP